MRPRELFGATLVLAGAAACTSVLGYGDLEVRDDGSAASSAGGATTGTGSTGGSGAGGGTGGGTSACGDGWQCVSPSAGASLVLIPAGGSCPSGWKLSARLYTGDGSDCEPCTCGASTGSCVHADVARFEDTTCTTLKDWQTAVGDGVCENVYELYSNEQAGSYRVTVDPESESCAPSAGVAQVLNRMPTCEPSGVPPGSCPGLEQCVPSVPSEEGRVCEWYGGDVECPDGDSYKRLVYQDVTDGRSCECACGAVSGSACSGAGVRLNEDPNCQGVDLTFVPAGGCQSVAGYATHDGYEANAGIYVPGSCAPESLLTGSVSFDQPVTLCCPS